MVAFDFEFIMEHKNFSKSYYLNAFINDYFSRALSFICFPDVFVFYLFLEKPS